MAMTTSALTHPSRRGLTLVTGSRAQRPLDRESAIRRVLETRRRVEARSERFAHLKRVYD